MNNSAALKKLSLMKAQIESMANTVTVLEKELSDGGASGGSARKGKLKEVEEKTNKFLARRRANKRKKADQ